MNLNLSNTDEPKAVITPRVRARILQAIDAILEEPRRLNMSVWARKVDKKGRNKPPCGTTACFAGWFAITGPRGKTLLRAIQTGKACDKSIKRELARALKLTEGSDEYRKIVNDTYWPHPFSEAYLKATTPKARAEVAARRFYHLLAHGE